MKFESPIHPILLPCLTPKNDHYQRTFVFPNITSLNGNILYILSSIFLFTQHCVLKAFPYSTNSFNSFLKNSIVVPLMSRDMPQIIYLFPCRLLILLLFSGLTDNDGVNSFAYSFRFTYKRIFRKNSRSGIYSLNMVF